MSKPQAQDFPNCSRTGFLSYPCTSLSTPLQVYSIPVFFQKGTK